MTRTNMPPSATSSTTITVTTTTNYRRKFSQPTHHNNKPTLAPHNLRTIASAVTSAVTAVPASARTNTPTYIHPKNHHHNIMEKIFCYGCEQSKTRMAFSTSQLNKMVAAQGAPKRALRYGEETGKGTHRPLCKSCTPAEVTELKCTNCSRTRLLEMFSKSQRRRQKDGSLICLECRKELDAEEVVVWSKEEENYEGKEYYGEEEEEGEGCSNGLEGGCDGGSGFGKMEFDWTVEAEEGDPDWHNGTLNDICL